MTEWRGRNIYAVTLELVDEAVGDTGKTSCPLPSVGACEGIVYGQYFGSNAAGATAEVVSRRVCESYDRDGVGAFETLNGAWAGVCGMARGDRRVSSGIGWVSRRCMRSGCRTA